MHRQPEPGLIAVVDLYSQGLSRAEIASRLRGRRRVAAGLYVDLPQDDPRTLHRVRIRALQHRMAGTVASHLSAALLWDLPVLDRDLSTVHLSPRAERRGHPKSGHGHRVHRWTVPEDAVRTLGGVQATAPLRTVIDCARLAGSDWGVVIADAALRTSLVTVDELAGACARVALVTGAERARSLPALASPLAESPGESLLRLRLCQMGPHVAEQVVLTDVPGLPRVDFLIDGRLVVEFDGESKYGIGGDAARSTGWRSSVMTASSRPATSPCA